VSAFVEDGRLKEKAMEHLVRRFRLFAVTGLIALSLSAFAGTAAAATGPAPGTGLVGACNMLLAWGVGANRGMANAMSVDNASGNDGMWQAVAVSGCPLRP
jgi:hypothetical protein